jgi:hypothetical protein
MKRICNSADIKIFKHIIMYHNFISPWNTQTPYSHYNWNQMLFVRHGVNRDPKSSTYLDIILRIYTSDNIHIFQIKREHVLACNNYWTYAFIYVYYGRITILAEANLLPSALRVITLLAGPWIYHLCSASHRTFNLPPHGRTKAISPHLAAPPRPPIQSPVQSPVQWPIQWPIQSPTQSPIQSPVQNKWSFSQTIFQSLSRNM